MHPHYPHLLVSELARLVQDGHGNEGFADIMQQCGANHAALVVLAHAEMLRESHRKAGDEEAVPVTVGVMAANRGQPFAQRGVLDGLQDLVFGLDDVAECQRRAGRKLLEYLDHHRLRGGNALVQGSCRDRSRRS